MRVQGVFLLYEESFRQGKKIIFKTKTDPSCGGSGAAVSGDVDLFTHIVEGVQSGV